MVLTWLDIYEIGGIFFKWVNLRPVVVQGHRDCKHDRLWVQFPFEEIKYFSFRSGNKAKSPALSSVTQHAVPGNNESGKWSVIIRRSLCLLCNMRDTAWVVCSSSSIHTIIIIGTELLVNTFFNKLHNYVRNYWYY